MFRLPGILLVTALAANWSADLASSSPLDCLEDVRNVPDPLAGLHPAARRFVEEQVSADCGSASVACDYHVQAVGSTGEIFVHVTFVREWGSECVVIVGDGRAWSFDASGAMLEEHIVL